MKFVFAQHIAVGLHSCCVPTAVKTFGCNPVLRPLCIDRSTASPPSGSPLDENNGASGKRIGDRIAENDASSHKSNESQNKPELCVKLRLVEAVQATVRSRSLGLQVAPCRLLSMVRKRRMGRTVEPVLRCAVRGFFLRSALSVYASEMLPASPYAVAFYKTFPPCPGDEFIAVGWSESAFYFGAAPSFLVTVIYGHNGEDQPPKISRRRTIRFDDRAESEKIFERECDIAQRDFPGRVDATEKIYASLRAA